MYNQDDDNLPDLDEPAINLLHKVVKKDKTEKLSTTKSYKSVHEISSDSSDEEYFTVDNLNLIATTADTLHNNATARSYSMTDSLKINQKTSSTISQSSSKLKSQMHRPISDTCFGNEVLDDHRKSNDKEKQGAKKKRTAEEIGKSKRQALLLKEAAKRKREEKKKEQEFEKRKRKAFMEARKQAKPGECLKHINATISPGVLTQKSGTAILEVLQSNNIKYDVLAQAHNHILTFWREVTEVTDAGEHKFGTVTQEKVEDNILLLLPVMEFISLVNNYKQKQCGLSQMEDLHEHIVGIKSCLEGRDVTVLIQGIEKYFRDQQTQDNRAFKRNVQGAEASKPKKKKDDDKIVVSRMDVEEALIHLQLNDGCNIRFAETEADIGKLVFNYAKAVAERPFKRDRLETGFTFHLESSGSIHVEKDGTGLSKVWRQQLQQFSMVTAEVANAIIAVYPSPWALVQAYENSSSKTCAEKLLENIEICQDISRQESNLTPKLRTTLEGAKFTPRISIGNICVRRGAGVMATTRRVGKELSRRIHQYFTTQDPDFVIL